MGFHVGVQRHGRHVGGAFALLVVGLLAYLHAFAVTEVPRPRSQPYASPDVLVCSGLPAVTDEVVQAVRVFWARSHRAVGAVRRIDCGTLRQCQAGRRALPCSPGNIVVTLRDRWFKEGHAGETVCSPREGESEWCTILLPSKLLASEEPDAPMLPPDADALVLAHEVGHWWGYEHAATPILGPFVSEPTGHVMNPRLSAAGWGDEGLGGTP